MVIGYQRWDRLLFLHFEVQQEALRALLPPRLELDTYEGRAFVSLTPFTVDGARLRGMPMLPGISRFHELNVRTYVRRGDDRGVWFFSLAAASPAPAAIARAARRGGGAGARGGGFPTAARGCKGWTRRDRSATTPCECCRRRRRPSPGR